MHRYLISLFILFLSIQFSWGANCESGLKLLAQKESATYVDPLIDQFKEMPQEFHESIRPLVLKALNYVKDNGLIKANSSDLQQEANRIRKHILELAENAHHYENVELTNPDPKRPDTFAFVYKGKKYIFRPLLGSQESLSIVRKTLAAGAIARRLTWRNTTVADSWVGIVNGVPGAISTYIPGMTLYSRNPLSMLYYQLMTSARGRNRSAILEFLFFNNDVYLQNVKVRRTRAIIFDHDRAFYDGIPIGPNHGFAYLRLSGTYLPDKIPRKIKKELLNLTPEELEKEVGGFLSILELNALIVRRQIILMK